MTLTPVGDCINFGNINVRHRTILYPLERESKVQSLPQTDYESEVMTVLVTIRKVHLEFLSIKVICHTSYDLNVYVKAQSH